MIPCSGNYLLGVLLNNKIQVVCITVPGYTSKVRFLYDRNKFLNIEKRNSNAGGDTGF
jgi:hypothetical protein